MPLAGWWGGVSHPALSADAFAVRGSHRGRGRAAARGGRNTRMCNVAITGPSKDAASAGGPPWCTGARRPKLHAFHIRYSPHLILPGGARIHTGDVTQSQITMRRNLSQPKADS